jgi:CheY-like chemotaxis protein
MISLLTGPSCVRCLTGNIIFGSGRWQRSFEILHQQHGNVSAIMLDLLMPGMNGQEFLDVKAKDPVLAISLSS